MPEISVVLPVFNAETTIERSVNSILNQTFTDFELIICNNNSSDNTYNICKKLKQSDKRIKLINEGKQGVVFAVNKALKKTTGKYIARTDADDVSLPERLKMQYDFLEENPDTYILGTKVKFCGDETGEGIRIYTEYTNEQITSDDIFNRRFSELQIINPSLMFRRQLIEKYGAYKHGDFPEDYEFFLRMLDKGTKPGKVDEYLIEWHDSKNRLTRTDNRYSTEAFFRVKTEYLHRHLKKYNPFYPKVLARIIHKKFLLKCVNYYICGN